MANVRAAGRSIEPQTLARKNEHTFFESFHPVGFTNAGAPLHHLSTWQDWVPVERISRYPSSMCTIKSRSVSLSFGGPRALVPRKPTPVLASVQLRIKPILFHFRNKEQENGSLWRTERVVAAIYREGACQNSCASTPFLGEFVL